MLELVSHTDVECINLAHPWQGCRLGKDQNPLSNPPPGLSPCERNGAQPESLMVDVIAQVAHRARL